MKTRNVQELKNGQKRINLPIECVWNGGDVIVFETISDDIIQMKRIFKNEDNKSIMEDMNK